MFSDADELAAACGMFISPAKPSSAAAAMGGAAAAAANKPRKLFLEDEAKGLLDGSGMEHMLHADLHPAPELSPSLWVRAM